MTGSSLSRRAVLRRSVPVGVASVPLASAGIRAESTPSSGHDDPAHRPELELFDDATHVADVAVDGATYSVFRVGNRVFAGEDGIEVHGDDGKVVNRRVAIRPLHRIGWQRGLTSHLTADVVEDVDELEETVAPVADLLASADRHLGRVAGPVRDLRSAEFSGGGTSVSAWDVVVSVVPVLGPFASLVLSASDAVGRWNDTTGEVVSTVSELRDSSLWSPPLSGVAAGEFAPAATDQIAAARSALASLAAATGRVRTGLRNVQEDVTGVLASVEQGVDAIFDEVPDFFPDDIVRGLVDSLLGGLEDLTGFVFSQLYDVLDPFIADLDDAVDRLDEGIDASELETRTLVDAWRTRRNTGGVVNPGLLVLVSALMLGWKKVASGRSAGSEP